MILALFHDRRGREGKDDVLGQGRWFYECPVSAMKDWERGVSKSRFFEGEWVGK